MNGGLMMGVVVMAGQIGTTLGVVVTAITGISIVAGLTVVFTLQRSDQIQKKQREWIEDLTGRLDYVEPKLKDVARENKMLRSLMNPTAQMERNHTEIMGILNHQSEVLSDIREQVEKRPA